jgi:hypothetical protein
MQLGEIDLASLEEVSKPTRWGVGTDRDRRIYRDNSFYYKIWGKNYLAQTLAAVGSEFRKICGLTTIHGLEAGLLTPQITTALVDIIIDEIGIVRGYITLRGAHPKEIPDDFADLVFDASVKSGWIFSDLKAENVVIIKNQCSLIDLDTHLSLLAKLDEHFETQFGCFRAHVTPRYRSHVLKFLRSQRDC